MKTFAVTMLSLSLAGTGRCRLRGRAAARPEQCQPAKAPQRVEGQVVEMSATQERIKVRDTAGATHEFQASAETIRDLKIGDKIEATLRPLPKC